MVMNMNPARLLAALALLAFLGSCRNGRSAASSVPKEKENAAAENKKPSKDPKAAEIKEKYAAQLGVSEKQIGNVALYKFIDEWYGTPYQYGGKTKKGIDCSGFTTALYLEVFKMSIVGSSASLYTMCEPMKTDELKEGDLVFFKISGNKISHVGVYLQNNKFVHATTKRGVMINDLDEAYYKKYFYKGGRLKQVVGSKKP